MCIYSEVTSKTAITRNAVQACWILNVSIFPPSVCLWFECLNYHVGRVCEIKVEKESRLA